MMHDISLHGSGTDIYAPFHAGPADNQAANQAGKKKSGGWISSLHESVLKQLGPAVTEQLPLIITRKCAMERALLQELNCCAGRGVSFSFVAAKLKEMANEEYFRIQRLYYATADQRVRNILKMPGASLSGFDRTPPPPFEMQVRHKCG